MVLGDYINSNYMQATVVFSGDDVSVEDTVELVEQLAVITEPDRTDNSLLPSSLNTTNQVKSFVLTRLGYCYTQHNQAWLKIKDMLNTC